MNTSLLGAIYYMHTLVLLCINQYIKFEVASFTNYNDTIKAKFQKGSRDSDHAPFRGGLSPWARI